MGSFAHSRASLVSASSILKRISAIELYWVVCDTFGGFVINRCSHSFFAFFEIYLQALTEIKISGVVCECFCWFII